MTLHRTSSGKGLRGKLVACLMISSGQIKRARTLGLFLSRGFTGRLANKPEPVPIGDDDHGRYNMMSFDGFLINPQTTFGFQVTATTCAEAVLGAGVCVARSAVGVIGVMLSRPKMGRVANGIYRRRHSCPQSQSVIT